MRAILKDERRRMVPLSDTTIWELEQKGDFPRRFYLTPRTPAWDYDEVLAWLEKRKAGATQQCNEHRPDVTKRKARPVRQTIRVVNS